MAHHGIVFKPEDLIVWVSSNPYQMGEFLAYDLKEVLDQPKNTNPTETLATHSLNIPKAPFLETNAYKNYKRYRVLRDEVELALKNESNITKAKQEELITLNPEFWEGYYLVGLYNYSKGYDRVALTYFKRLWRKK